MRMLSSIFTRTSVAMLALMSLASVPASATPILDQESPETGVLFNADTSHWQSFTAGLSGALTTLRVNPWWTNPENNFTLNLYEGTGVSGDLLYSESGIFIDNGSGPQTWDIDLAGLAFVAADAVYTWQLQNAQEFRLVGFAWSDYDRGMADPGAHFQGGVTPDYNFATFVDTDVTVPAPAGVLLLSLGLVGLAAGRRQRNA